MVPNIITLRYLSRAQDVLAANRGRVAGTPNFTTQIKTGSIQWNRSPLLHGHWVHCLKEAFVANTSVDCHHSAELPADVVSSFHSLVTTQCSLTSALILASIPTTVQLTGSRLLAPATTIATTCKAHATSNPRRQLYMRTKATYKKFINTLASSGPPPRSQS